MTNLIIPGHGNSGPSHWQTKWESILPHCHRVQMSDWENPKLSDWISKLNEAIVESDGPINLIAHSLAVSLVSHWAARHSSQKVQTALLVSPADIDEVSKRFAAVVDFINIPLKPLPFKSLVVASEDDPFVSFEKARFFAESWGSDFVSIGKKGHINADSNLGHWPEGMKLFEHLIG